MKCPECAEKIALIPQRLPIEQGVTTSAFNLDGGASTIFTGPEYSPRERVYKCSNSKCWVTKVELRW